MPEQGRDPRTVEVSVFGEVALWLIEAGRQYLSAHPDEVEGEPDILTLISSGCKYLREHPEAKRVLSRGTPGGQSRG